MRESTPAGETFMTTVRAIIGAKPIQDIITIKPTQEVSEAAQLLAKNRIGAVIVSGDGSTVDGIFSERDIVRALGTTGIGCMDQQVKDLMTSSVTGCKPDDSAHSVMQKMTEGRFRHMPVIEGGRMIGVISIGDVVKARIMEIEHENTALTDMIVGHG
jgi:CBS domain-containing protein